MEVGEGQYDFSTLWEYVHRAEDAGRLVVLQIQTNSPGNFPKPVIPEHYWGRIAELPDCPVSRPDCGLYYHSKPAPWDEDYLAALERLVGAFAREFDGHPAVMAVLIAGPGNYNEMSQTVGACYGQPGADVTRPDSMYIQSLAQETGESPEVLTRPYTDGAGRSYVAKFDYYYVEVTKRIAHIYLDNFKRTPAILQLGSGVSCQMYVPRYVVDDLLKEGYGGRLWLKQNGWGNTVSAPDFPYAYDALFASYASRGVRTMYEVGHYNLWCSKESGERYNCWWLTDEQARKHNLTVIDNALAAGVSAVCLQSAFFAAPDVFLLNQNDVRTLRMRLEENKHGR